MDVRSYMLYKMESLRASSPVEERKIIVPLISLETRAQLSKLFAEFEDAITLHSFENVTSLIF